MISRQLTTIAEAQACFNGMLRFCPNNLTWKWGTIIYEPGLREVTFAITHTNDAVERVSIKEHIPGLTIDTMEYVVRTFFMCDLGMVSDAHMPPSFKLVNWSNEECSPKNKNLSFEEASQNLKAFINRCGASKYDGSMVSDLSK